MWLDDEELFTNGNGKATKNVSTQHCTIIISDRVPSANYRFSEFLVASGTFNAGRWLYNRNYRAIIRRTMIIIHGPMAQR